jgi:hypothetical protein
VKEDVMIDLRLRSIGVAMFWDVIFEDGSAFWDYKSFFTLTPSKTGYSFSPSKRTVKIQGKNAGGFNFTGTGNP